MAETDKTNEGQLTWLGHAAFEFVSRGKRVFIDPFLTDNPAAVRSADEIEPDFIIVTHGHGDHIGDTVDVAKRTKALVIANYEIAEWLGKQGVENTHPMSTGGSHAFDFGTLKLTIAHHGSMLPDGSYGGPPCGLLLKIDQGTIYHAADTALFGDMKLIGEEGVDLAILPIGDNFTMGPDDSIRATNLVQPKRVLATHYDTWPLIAQDAEAWAHRVRQETTAEPIVLKPGEHIDISG